MIICCMIFLVAFLAVRWIDPTKLHLEDIIYNYAAVLAVWRGLGGYNIYVSSIKNKLHEILNELKYLPSQLFIIIIDTV